MVTRKIFVGTIALIVAAGTATTLATYAAARPAAKAHRLTLTTKELHETDFGNSAFTEIDRMKAHGKEAGGALYDCSLNNAAKTARCYETFGLKKGTIRSVVTVSQTTGKFSNGSIFGGTRAYTGMSGTETGSATEHGAHVVLNFHK
jgi:hypothetical protein